MSDDLGGTEKETPAEEQRGEKRKNSERCSEAGSDSSWQIRKILLDLSYASYDSEPLSPLINKNSNRKFYDEKDEIDENMSDSSSVVFVGELREPDPTPKATNYSALAATNNSDDAYTETSYEDKTPPEEDEFSNLSDPTGKVNDWLLQGQNQSKPKRKKNDERTSREYDFEDLSDSMFEWLLKSTEEQEAKQQQLRNTISALCRASANAKKAAEEQKKRNAEEAATSSDSSVSRVELHVLPSSGDPSSQPARKIYIDPDIIEISDDEEVNEEALADDSNGKSHEKLNESGREETKTQPETDFKEMNNNDIQTATMNSTEPSQDTENEKDKETLEHDTQDNSEIVSNEHVEDDSQNLDPNLELPEIECSTESPLEVSTLTLDEDCTDLVQWLFND